MDEEKLKQRILEDMKQMTEEEEERMAQWAREHPEEDAWLLERVRNPEKILSQM